MSWGITYVLKYQDFILKREKVWRLLWNNGENAWEAGTGQGGAEVAQ
jgi:hypothetical protein